MKIAFLMLLASSLLATSSFGGESPELCDMPGGNYTSVSTKSVDLCQTTCLQDEKCKAWSYISGWNKCFLKSKISKKFKIAIYSGYIRVENGERKLVEAKWDQDNSGKDMKMVGGLKTEAACSAACVKNEKCKAIAYISGYSSCWLKKSNGKQRAKKFYCGVASESKP